MVKILFRELEDLKGRLRTLSTMVQQSVTGAVHALEHRDADEARRVVEHDEAIDRLEVQIEEECLKLLALHQPVAIDLRFIVATLKMNSDLERIADLAASIALRAADLSQLPEVQPLFDVSAMASGVTTMLATSIEAMLQLDTAMARTVSASDEAVNRINRSAHAAAAERFKTAPEAVPQTMLWFLIARNLERIADHTTNIAEDAIYMVEGEIVRHTSARF